MPDSYVDKFVAGTSRTFSTHRLTVEQGTGEARVWLCGRPDTNNMSFRVVAAPYALAVYGDAPTDHILWHPSNRDMVAWLRGAIHSGPGYVMSKVAGEAERRKVFAPDLVTRAVEDDLRQAWADRADFEEGRQYVRGYVATLRQWRDALDFCEPPTERDAFECMPDWFESEESSAWFRPTDEVLRTWCALECFCRLMDEAEDKADG